MGKFYQCIQSYGPSFVTKFGSALYLENLLTNIFAKLNLRGGLSCMPAALLLLFIEMAMLTNLSTSMLACTDFFRNSAAYPYISADSGRTVLSL